MASKVARQEETLRRIWTRKRARRERSDKGRHSKLFQSFAKEFGRGVRQQRTRGKTKGRAGTLPLALSMFRRNASAHGDEGQTTLHMRLSIQKAT